MNETPLHILQKYWGYTSFKPAQEAIIESVLQQKDTLALLPTGGGKSICYQVPALLKEGICIVVSPLIALIQDQVAQLQKKNIKAIALSGKLSFAEVNQLLDNCLYGNYKFLYLSPERLQNQLVQERIKQMQVSLIAIDEAHCISQWGHDFRPDYRKLTILKELQAQTPIIALTATATPQVVDDIIKTLEIDEPQVFKSSFKRENIHFYIQERADKNLYLLDYLKKNEGSSIIYVRNRKSTLQLQTLLSENKFSAEAYHGGIANDERKKILNHWLANKTQIIIATTAFGMGIDKADVKNVIHYHIPESIESYYQEAGRAGRNGKKATALLLYNQSDFELIDNQFVRNIPTKKQVAFIYKKLNNYFEIAYGELREETLNFGFYEFCKTYKIPLQIGYNSLETLNNCGILQLEKQYQQQISLQVIISQKAVIAYAQNNFKYKFLIEYLLRNQTAIFDEMISIKLEKIEKKIDLQPQDIIKRLQELHDSEIIRLEIKNQDTSIRFLVPREDKYTLNTNTESIKQIRKSKLDKIEAIKKLILQQKTCIVIQILSYFGEENSKPCGKCSVCAGNKNSRQAINKTEIKNKIIDLLAHKSFNLKDLVLQFDENHETVINIIRDLNEQQIIKISENNIVKLQKNE
ncbi:ATP-dependent DNA helicase RecQ [Mesonia sp. K7]|uniref:RecQ family ATP-dependent DNA helicase n=1 Tax=Mesonia sp. K7 TaxID=2218606 RepID=UPI000DA9FEB3|nr:ATP-dependent DNA helicase RecQ [Mesonia sp. K7]PZD78218.1 RecQ family ATP-dependent DNA helicase [Mesonia sp. K7]